MKSKNNPAQAVKNKTDAPVKDKEFVVDVLIIPSKLEAMIGGAKVRTEKRSVFGTSRREAIKNAGIR